MLHNHSLGELCERSIIIILVLHKRYKARMVRYCFTKDTIELKYELSKCRHYDTWCNLSDSKNQIKPEPYTY